MLATNWGYSIDVDKIPPLLTVNEFDSMGGSSMSSSYEAKQATLNGVSQAIRDYCGWHVAPKLTCKAIVPDSAHVILPSMGVTELTETVPTVEPHYANSYGVIDMRRQALLEVTYVAGFDMVDALKQAAYQIAANHLVATAGLREEHAGQVGATYNQTDSGVSGGVRLLASDKAMLAPYKLVGV